MNLVNQILADKLKEREEAGNLRSLSTIRAQADFFSNDYLGFATTGLLNQLAADTYDGPGATGSMGSRLLAGNSVEAEQLEQCIASFHKAEAALLFNSGYNANIGLVSAIADRHTTIIYDELCHASIIDGVRLSPGLSHFKFKHNDTTDLREKLAKNTDSRPIIVLVESVYSMDGDQAPLVEIAGLCATHNAALIVDEAHATGIFGEKGEGLVCELGLRDTVFARVHTFGKALGCHGAAVTGSALLRQYLVNYSRSFIYTTALPQHSLRVIQTAYDHLSSSDFTAKPIHELITYFNMVKPVSGIEGWIDSKSPIQALVAGNNEKCKKLADSLQKEGFQINPILSPTVPKGKERLRICLHTFNNPGQIDLIMDILKKQC